MTCPESAGRQTTHPHRVESGSKGIREVRRGLGDNDIVHERALAGVGEVVLGNDVELIVIDPST